QTTRNDIEASHLPVLDLDDAEQCRPVAALARLRLQVDRAGEAAVLQRQLQLLDLVRFPQGRLTARVIDQMKTGQTLLDALGQLPAHDGLGLILAQPQVIAAERLLRRLARLRGLVVAAEHLAGDVDDKAAAGWLEL